jgi:chromosomal replication initiation ATPase DnaA
MADFIRALPLRTMMTSRQLSLDLAPGAGAQSAADFFPAPSNADALALIRDDGLWPDGKLILKGPEGAGKSHLAGIWARAVGAWPVAGDPWDDPPRGATHILVEAADRVTGRAEEALFHLHNRVLAADGRLLLTARTSPGHWPMRLPDLISRMQATTVIALGDPDDALFPRLLAKLFADRQIAPAPDLIPWLTVRLERTHRAAILAVAALDAAGLARGREINRTLAREVLDIGPGPGADEPSPD